MTIDDYILDPKPYPAACEAFAEDSYWPLYISAARRIGFSKGLPELSHGIHKLSEYRVLDVKAFGYAVLKKKEDNT